VDVPSHLVVVVMARTVPADREAFWRKLVTDQASSRRSIVDLCRQAGVSTASFYAWRQRLRASGTAVSPASSLIPVRIVPEPNPVETPALAERVEREPITIEVDTTPTLRICIPAGCDEETIRRVLRAALQANGGAAS
jgi:Transposase